MSRCLVVNADDFGRTPGVSDGILEAHLEGIVTSTTVMINLPGAAEAVRHARAEAPGLSLGVHLNLTHGRPILPASQVPSLVDGSGGFRSYADLCASAGQIELDQVLREWEAQIQALAATGATLDHLDSHHFIAELTPATWRTYLGLARQHNLGVRGPRPPQVGHQQLLPSAPETFRLDFDSARAELIASGVPSSDGLRVDFFREDANQELLLSLLEGLPDGVTELMTHPGHVDDLLQASSSYGLERETELQVLTSEVTRRAIEDSGIRLTRYADALMS